MKFGKSSRRHVLANITILGRIEYNFVTLQLYTNYSLLPSQPRRLYLIT